MITGILENSTESSEEAKQNPFLKRLELPKLQDVPKGGIYLRLDKQGLHIEDASYHPPMTYKVDFQRGRLAYRKKGSGGKEDLLKAVGNINPQSLIVDMTMGFAEDSMLLSSLNRPLIAIEENPVVCALVEDALRRLGERPFSIHCQEAVGWLKQMNKKPEIIYMDPMFPSDHSKKSKVKKEMQILKKIVSPRLSDRELLDTALHFALHKVIVKRPIQAEPLDGPKPNYNIKGKSVRFDVYQL